MSLYVYKKDKNTAIILNFCFGCFGWLYSYKYDAWKFWLGLGVCLTMWWLLFIPNVLVWLWALIDAGVKDKRFYEDYYK